MKKLILCSVLAASIFPSFAQVKKAVKAPVAVVAGGAWGCRADSFISFWGMGCPKSFDMPCRYQPNEKIGPVRAIRNKNTKT